MAELPLAQGIDRFKQNEDRMDRFTNGTDVQEFITSGGVAVPTIRKFIKDKDTEINQGANSILTAARNARDVALKAKDDSEDARDMSIAARDDSISVKDASETARDDAIAAKDLSEAWAEGTLPGGAGTKSAKEWAAEASDNALNKFMQTGTGAVERTLTDKLRDVVDIRDFGAVPNGSTPAQAAINAALAAHKTVRISGDYFISGTIQVPAGRALIADNRQGGTIYCNGNFTAIQTNGHNVRLSGLKVGHDGNGKILDASQDEGVVVEACEFTSGATSATEPLVLMTGSFGLLKDTIFTNTRTNAWSVDIDKSGTLINIESAIDNCRFGGEGKGLRIGSQDGSPRPEGIRLVNTTFIGTNVNLQIEQVFQLTIVGTMFDQGNSRQVVFKPTGQGIGLVQFTGGYISTPNNMSDGVGVWHDITNPSVPIEHVTFNGVTFSFGWKAAYFTSSAKNINFSGGNVSNMASTGFQIGQAKNVTVNGVQFTGIGLYNIALEDGAAGGPFSVDCNQFHVGAGFVFTKTDANKFIFGPSNTGRRLAGWSSVTTTTTAHPNASYINIPHGLDGVPRRDRIILNVVPITAQMSPVPGAVVAAINATEITVQVSYAAPTAGSYSINAMTSL